ncbi:MAG: archease, partial [Gemmatimonadota bacterium]
MSFLDHTADVGILVRAGSAEALFHHAALGMLSLLRGEEEVDPSAAPDRSTPATVSAPRPVSVSGRPRNRSARGGGSAARGGGSAA